MKTIWMLALLTAGAAQANGLDDLKTALGTLKGESPLRGVYELQRETVNVDGDDRTPDKARASALVEEDANGLSIRWDRSLLKKALDESQIAKGAKRKTPVADAMGWASPPRLANTLNFAPAMLQMLANCTQKSERADAWQGKPARMLELVYNDPEAMDSRLSVKENAHAAQVWIDADGMPLAASITHKFRGSAFIIINFEQTGREDYSFSVRNNRLVVLKREDQGRGKNAGTENQFHHIYTFTPKT